ncbi:MAG: cohesin domain-containing protein [Candidatus Shapirobacteria bacterium]
MKLKFLILMLLIASLAAALFLVQNRQLWQKKATLAGPAFALIPNSVTVKPGESFDLDLYVQNPTNIPLNAADVVISFPQNQLQLTNLETNAKTNTTFKTFVPVLNADSGIFDLNRVISAANQSGGKLEFGAVTFDWSSQSVTSPVSTTFKLARLTFTANAQLTAPVTAQIAFAFAADNSTDSNLVNAETAADVLTQADPVSININPASSPSSLTVKFKFQGITDNRAAGKTIKLLNEDFPVEYDSGEIYSVTKNNLAVGEYAVGIKGWVHLQKNCASATLTAGQTTIVDCTTDYLKAGDFDNNNLLNINDISALIGKYTTLNVPVDEYNRRFDVDANNVINIVDLSLVISNYTALNISGDQ